MAYYLTIRENNSYKKLDISDMVYFKRESKFKGSSLSLDELDKFTSNYANEKELKEDLYESRVITLDEINKELSIRMLTKGNLEKVMYDPVYKDSYKYLDPIYLRSVLLSLQQDSKFLEKLVVQYRNSHVNNYTVFQIKSALNNAYYRDMYKLLEEFFQKEIFTIDKNTSEVKIKYKSLHDLAMFVGNYIEKEKLAREGFTKEEKRKKIKEELLLLKQEIISENERQIEAKRKYEDECRRAAEEDMIEDYLQKHSIEPKTRKKSKIEIEGQVNLFD